MASGADWIEGARPRTLPAAIAPVVVGSGVAYFHGGFDPVRALLALMVALALQVGVNFANDYSDGIRGTDGGEDRVGPRRLVGSGAASPRVVLSAAVASFGVACAAGLALVLLTSAWWLLGVGVAAIAAAWFYTGGRRPYGYAGWGELFVFLFFGLVAVCGTTFVQLGRVPLSSVWAAVAMGTLACGVLVSNNLRDLDGDARAGKRTLAVRLGSSRTRWFYVVLAALAMVGVYQVAATTTWWALLGWLMAGMLVGPVRLMLSGAVGPELVRVLRLTGLALLVGAAGMVAGLAVGA